MMREDWVETELGKVCFTTSGGTPSRKVAEYYIGNIPWVKSGELKQNNIFETEEHISKEAVKSSSAKIFPKGTLLIALYGATIGKLAILGIEAATNQAVCGIFKNEAFETRFLFYYLFHKKQKLIEQGAGGAQPNISQTILKKLHVPIAPLPEQRAIVAKIEKLLSDLDNGIANLKNAKAKLDIYRQALLKKAFEGQLTGKWREARGRTQYDSAPRKEDNLPKQWEWVKLENICEFISDGDHQAPPKSETGIPFVTISNVNKTTFKIDFSNTFFVTPQYFSQIKSSRKPDIGDILYTVTGSFGISILIDFKKDFCFQRHIGLVRPLDFVNQRWLFYLLQSPLVFSQAKNTATGTAQKTVSLNSLRNFEIPLTSRDEQTAIVAAIESRLSVCDKLAESIDQSLEKAEALRQSILKKAFAGKLLSEAEIAACRRETDWEPAHKLLEKIKKSGNEQTRSNKAKNRGK